MIKKHNDVYDEDLDNIMKTVYKVNASGESQPKMWAYCQDCTIMGSYEWCPKSIDKKTLDAEYGCPLGKRILN